MWAAGNFLFLVVLAHQSPVTTFGEVGLAFGVVVLCSGLAIAMGGETLAVERGLLLRSSPDWDLAAARGRASAVVSVLAVVAGVGTLGVHAAVRGGHIGPVGAALAVGAAAAVVADGMRSLRYAVRDPGVVSMALIWLVVEAAVFVGGALSGDLTPLTVVAGWTCAATAAAAVGWTQAGAVPSLRGAWSARRLRFGSEHLLASAPAQAMVFLSGAMIGVPAAAAMRALQSVFGPVNIVVQGALNAALPAVSEVRGTAGRASVVLSVAGAVIALGATSVMSIPGVGSALMGDSWPTSGRTVVLFGIGRAAVGVTFGALLVMRAYDESRRTLQLRSVTAVFFVAAFSGGSRWGLDGALGLSTLVLVLAALAWSRLARRLTRDR